MGSPIVPPSGDEVFASLTSSQRDAVRHVDGPLLILAGPGSGKTRVVTHRVAHLLRLGIPAARILAMTFTNKAADEMKDRVRRLAPGQRVWIGTFHRFCAQLLRRRAPLVGLTENFSIYDADDSARALRRAAEEENLDLSRVSPARIAAEISRAKVNLIPSDKYEPRRRTPTATFAARVYPVYQRLLRSSNAVDFDDLLLHVALLLRENSELRRSLDDRYRYIMVDEYQDTNRVQYEIVRALSTDQPNLAVTGDPDQLIYGWRGATLHNILEFERDFPGAQIVRLEQNYRSTKSILRVADELITHNVKRKEKTLFTENPQGPPVRLRVYPSGRDEAEDIAEQIAQAIRHDRRPRDFAVFYRINALSRVVEHALRARRIPYQIVRGLEFYQRREVKDMLAYLHLLNNAADDGAFLRIVNAPPRGIGRTTLEQIRGRARSQGLPLMEAARQCRLIPSLHKRPAAAVERFTTIYDRLLTRIHRPVAEIIDCAAVESGYRNWLEQSDAEADAERLANIDELVTAAKEMEEQDPSQSGLDAFLERAALVSDTDQWDTQTDLVTLMTLHAAKGLEFPVVFIVAVEEGLLPHERCRDDSDQLEEERRLLFVGMTRAEQELQLSMAGRRTRRGAPWPTVPSQFLMELPRRDMDVFEPPERFENAAWSQEDDEAPPQREAGRRRPQRQRRPRPAPDPPESGLQTAAEMLGDRPMQNASPDSFRKGMLVNHPEYGPGAILELAGRGAKRTATIRFLATSQTKKFRLAHCPLQPM